MECAYCAVRTGSLSKEINYSSSSKELKYRKKSIITSIRKLLMGLWDAEFSDYPSAVVEECVDWNLTLRHCMQFPNFRRKLAFFRNVENPSLKDAVSCLRRMNSSGILDVSIPRQS